MLPSEVIGQGKNNTGCSVHPCILFCLQWNTFSNTLKNTCTNIRAFDSHKRSVKGLFYEEDTAHEKFNVVETEATSILSPPTSIFGIQEVSKRHNLKTGKNIFSFQMKIFLHKRLDGSMILKNDLYII